LNKKIKDHVYHSFENKNIEFVKQLFYKIKKEEKKSILLENDDDIKNLWIDKKEEILKNKIEEKILNLPITQHNKEKNI